VDFPFYLMCQQHFVRSLLCLSFTISLKLVCIYNITKSRANIAKLLRGRTATASTILEKKALEAQKRKEAQRKRSRD
jgi:hypothetical protein